MSAGAPIHPEIMLSLADEIRQTIAWLGEQEDPPAEQVTSRIRTLREAATVAGLESVGSILTGLDEELAAAADPATKIVRVLDRLSTAILNTASSLENQQLEWIQRSREIEQTLDDICREISRGADRLTGGVSFLESASMAPSDADRRNLMQRAIEHLTGEIARQRRIRDNLRGSIAVLRAGTRKLTGDLSGLLTVPLLPMLLKLREEVRVLARDQGKPVSLHPRCSGVELSSRQVEPLGRVLDHLVKQALDEGLETPQQRRKAGKPTVGVLRITAKAGKSILEVELQDDGRSERPEVKLPRAIKKDLSSLRARLLRQTGQDHGQHLTLQVPVWPSSMEVIPVETPVGEMLVPLATVGRVFSGGEEPSGDLPVISLQRRAEDHQGNHPDSGVVFEIEGWRGIMYAKLLNTHFRVIPSQPEAGDPPWVIGRVWSAGPSAGAPGGKPVVHPLPFMKLTEEQTCLFPSVEK
jgi:hypothetical protein